MLAGPVGSVVQASVDEFNVQRLLCSGGPPTIDCVPKVSSAGCLNSISTSDLANHPTSGAGGYLVTCSGVQGAKNGLLFASTAGAASTPFVGGTLCMNPPLKRGPVVNSGGTNPMTCDGSFSQVINDGLVIPLGLDAGAGNTGWYQFWYRDPGNGVGSLGTALSDAVELDFQ